MAGGETQLQCDSEAELVEAACACLSSRLPPGWSVEKVTLEKGARALDLLVRDATGSERSVLVQVRADFSHRDAEALASSLPSRLRAQSEAPLLVVAPHIGASARQLLRAENISYIDLTGNVRIVLDSPGLFVEAQGVDQEGVVRPATSLRGEQSGAVIRLLVDVRPPYTAAEVAEAVNVNEGYVSRILGTLLEEDLIERPSRGPVAEVDWQGLIRRRAQAVDLFKRRGAYRLSAADDPSTLLGQGMSDSDAVVTGSFAAARLASVPTPKVLTAYAKDPRALAARLELARAHKNSDVLLIRPDNPVVFDRVELEQSVAYAAPSQIAIDCLSGDRVMRSQGVAVLDWMRGNEERWRLPSIDLAYDSTLTQ